MASSKMKVNQVFFQASRLKTKTAQILHEDTLLQTNDMKFVTEKLK